MVSSVENVNPELSCYFQRLKRLLDCPKKLRISFLNQTQRMAEDFLQGKPDATQEELIDYLGEPEELAHGFLEDLEPGVVERYRKRKRFLLLGCISVLSVSLIIVAIFGLYFQKVPLDLEVTETITIYSNDVERAT